ncbi:glutaredoxin family protein [Halalkalibacter oceani]|uniref:Glutaredoxin family protein n=1 Tax=Halalkalibacter oceani TaxID=1653776 RepID=A0A9X2DPC9_9BACI|nr:glutaredoxin family protein [Halalkalibacter oceani]MCM3713882.1 glutaredoxin family protein [Halalkalibacter oceani]
MSSQVLVYTTDDCIECEYVKRFLESEGIAFLTKNIKDNPEYEQEVQAYGYLGVPVTVFKEQAIKGLTPDLQKLVKAVRDQG